MRAQSRMFLSYSKPAWLTKIHGGCLRHMLNKICRKKIQGFEILLEPKNRRMPILGETAWLSLGFSYLSAKEVSSGSTGSDLSNGIICDLVVYFDSSFVKRAYLYMEAYIYPILLFSCSKCRQLCLSSAFVS